MTSRMRESFQKLGRSVPGEINQITFELKIKQRIYSLLGLGIIQGGGGDYSWDFSKPEGWQAKNKSS